MALNEHICEKLGELKEQGFCILQQRFDPLAVEACRAAFWPRLLRYLSAGHEPNRGPNRHFLAMPFDLPVFAPHFFFDDIVLWDRLRPDG